MSASESVVVGGRPHTTMARTIAGVGYLQEASQPPAFHRLPSLHPSLAHRKSFEYEDAARLTVKPDELGGGAKPAALCHAYSDDNIYEDIACKSKIRRRRLHRDRDCDYAQRLRPGVFLDAGFVQQAQRQEVINSAEWKILQKGSFGTHFIASHRRWGSFSIKRRSSTSSLSTSGRSTKERLLREGCAVWRSL